MFRSNKSTDKFETLLGSTASFDGHLKCAGGVRIEGEYKGSIETDGNIVVGKSAVLTADLHGHDVLVSGKVVGNIFAQGQLAILASGKVNGDVEVGSILIEEGGVFSGKSAIRTKG
ncbi:MAG: polymer-forming cytoskeletal protein [Chloroflexota bacterium]